MNYLSGGVEKGVEIKPTLIYADGMKNQTLVLSFTLLVILSSCIAPTPLSPSQESISPSVEVIQSPTQDLNLSTATIIPIPVLTATIEFNKESVNLIQFEMFALTTGWGIGKSADNTPMVLRSADGGRTWMDTKLPVDVSIYDGLKMAGYFLDDQTAWVAPFNESRYPLSENSVWRTTDGGKTWNISLIQTKDLMESYYVSQINFVDNQNGWFMTHVGAGMNHDYIAIYRTTDGGINWERAADPMNDSSGIQGCQKNGFVFSDSQNGWLTGTCNGVAPGVLLFNTKDGGATWNRVELDDPYGYSGLYQSFDAVCSSQYPDASIGLIHLEVACKNMAAPMDRPIVTLYTSLDGGDSWVQKSIPPGILNYLPEDGLMVIGEEVSISWDGGDSWERQPNAPEGLSAQFVDGEYGWILPSSGKDIFQTVDGGKTWQSITPLLVE